MAAAFSVRQADYGHPSDAAAVVSLLDAYACDPAGGGEPLSDFVKANHFNDDKFVQVRVDIFFK